MILILRNFPQNDRKKEFSVCIYCFLLFFYVYKCFSRTLLFRYYHLFFVFHFIRSQSGKNNTSATNLVVQNHNNNNNNNNPNNIGQKNNLFIIGGSANDINQIADSTKSYPRHASSFNDLPVVASVLSTVAATGIAVGAANGGSNNNINNNNNHNNKQQLASDLKSITNTNTAEPATIRSKFTPGNIFKNFFK